MKGQVIFTTKRQEDNLLRKIQAGNEKEADEAWLKLFKILHPLLYAVASFYLEQGLSEKELYALGRKGLKIATLKYHGYDDEYKFSTYATWFIREEIHKKLGIKTEK